MNQATFVQNLYQCHRVPSAPSIAFVENVCFIPEPLELLTGVLTHTLWLEVEEGWRTERTHTTQASALAEVLQRRW